MNTFKAILALLVFCSFTAISWSQNTSEPYKSTTETELEVYNNKLNKEIAALEKVQVSLEEEKAELEQKVSSLAKNSEEFKSVNEQLDVIALKQTLLIEEIKELEAKKK